MVINSIREKSIFKILASVKKIKKLSSFIIKLLYAKNCRKNLIEIFKKMKMSVNFFRANEFHGYVIDMSDCITCRKRILIRVFSYGHWN